MTRVMLRLPRDAFKTIIEHLLLPDCADEQAAFGFATVVTTGLSLELRVIEHVLVHADGFAAQSPWHLELTDETRGRVIKRAHELEAAIVEFHSHPGGAARFSWSDKVGLHEFVPHARWRLKGKAYAAIVVGDRCVRPSGWSARNWKELDHVRATL